MARAEGFSTPFPLVYKEFSHDSEVKPAALDTMVSLRRGLETRDREFLDRHTTWPLILVEEAGRVVGYLMQAVPPAYFQKFRLSTGTKQKPREIQQLFQSDELSKRNLGIVPTWRERFRIARVAAHVIDFLHTHELVFGDISYKNEVWALQPSATVMFVDCDAIRPRGQSSAVPQAHSPGWEPPERHAVQTIQTDRYKLGLLVLRCLSPGVNAENREPATADAHLDAEGRTLLRRALGDDPDARPTGGEWVTYLDRAISRLPAEPVRSAGPPPPPAPPPPMVASHSRPAGSRFVPITPRARARIVAAAGPPRTVYGTAGTSWKSPTPSRYGFGHPPSNLRPPSGTGFWQTGRLSTRSVIQVIAIGIVGILFALFAGVNQNKTSSSSHVTSTPTGSGSRALLVRAVAPLTDPSFPGDHKTGPSAEFATGSYAIERNLGSVLSAPGNGGRALYSCVGVADAFTSKDAHCEGRGEGRLLGYALDIPTAGVSTAPLFRCFTGTDHFDSTDPTCEGFQKDVLFGYVIVG